MRGQTGRRGFMIGSGLTMLGWSKAEAHSAVIRTKDGALEGVSTAVPGVTAWLGIPYAEPPVGPLRWRPPQPVRAWKGVRRADHFGHSPYAPSSLSGDTDSAFTPADMSEDCLTLNVWAPPRRGTLRPVMVWIYGGAFIMGSSADPHYNGAALAAEDVVVVSLNYRVGILGSFAHPELARESPRASRAIMA
ncbi:carboxylesterase family protein [Komagataeibacter intermedius]|uniref:carboxylesterase family protein n=1 Tax=Komagataeibacter intermedius TaxID=66229 RepID=UPI003B434EB0